MEKWVRMARQAARKAGRDVTVENDHVVCGGKPDLPDDLRLCIAYHEAGHAIAHLALGTAMPNRSRSAATAVVRRARPGRLQLPTREYLGKLLMTTLAGRAAKQLKFNEATTGAGGASAGAKSRSARPFGPADRKRLWLRTYRPRDALGGPSQ